MSHLLKRKQDHETSCEEEVQKENYDKARYHAAKAADYALALANSVDPTIAEQYVKDSEAWLEIAEQLEQKKAAQAPNSSSSSSSKQAIKDDDTDNNEWLVEEKPDVRFSDIAGMETAKQSIRDMVIHPLSKPEVAKALGIRAGGGVLLYGPPGNGKTLLGKAIANELDCAFFYASGAQIRSKWHGESEQRLRKLLQAAKSHKKAILFLDEVDGLLPKRSSGSSVVDNRIVTQFLAEIGGFEDSDNTLLILGATNKPWDIDEAVFRTGRFDQKIYIPPPDPEARKAILELNLKAVPREENINLATWAEKLDGYTGSDITGLVQAAKRSALSRSISTDTEPNILITDLEAALPTIHPSIHDRMLKQFKKFRTTKP